MKRCIAHNAVYILLLTVAAVTMSSCGADRNLKKGEKYLALGEYYDAADEFKKAYQKTNTKERAKRGLIAERQALCYQRINYTQKAIAAWRNVIRYKQDDTAAHLDFARQLLRNGNYREAEAEFLAVLDSVASGALNTTDDNIASLGDTLTTDTVKPKRRKKSKTTDIRKATDTQYTAADIEQLARNGYISARTAPKIKEDGSRYIVKRMDVLNSRRADYSPMLYGDEYDYIYFTSTRNEAEGDELSGITGTKPGDIFYSQKDDKGKWGKPQQIDGGLNTEDDEGACCFSPDEREMYITQCSTDPSYPRYATIATSSRSDASWGKATKLDLTRDTLSNFAHPAVSPDGVWLYFTSDMPGGKGGLDIWRVRLTSAGLGGVENLGEPVNTAGNEMFPTFRPNGDFYFSSDGHPGLGGLDIFIAKTDKQTRRYVLEHPGYPLNSQGDDFGMTFEGAHNRGYFSSNRNDGKGWDHIYSFELPEIVQTVKGWVYEMDGYELPAAQVYMVGSDGTNLRLSVRGDGSFEQTINPDVDYIFLATCKGFLNHKEELRVEPVEESEQYTLQFPLASIRVPVLIDNIFYDFDRYTLRPESTTALDELVQLLQENPNVTIELSAHCDYRGSEQYNLTLSQRRAESVVNYLIDHGIASDRLTPVGYGKGKPKTIRKKLTEKYPWLKEDDVLTEEFITALDDEEKQEICNQLNRRTEFIVLRITYGMFDDDGNLKNPPQPKNDDLEDEGDDDFYIDLF